MGFGLRTVDSGGICRERRDELDLQREKLDFAERAGFPKRGAGFTEREEGGVAEMRMREEMQTRTDFFVEIFM